MCGRFTLRDPAKAYQAFLRRQVTDLPEPRFNVAPGQKLPVIRPATGGGREIEELFWGFVPPWVDPGEKPSPIINARSETAPAKPAFREAFRRRRCIVPADGFYEWRREGGGKAPYFFRLHNDRPFALAALWEEWHPRAGETVQTFCLLTTGANALLAPIHDRMPVMLDEAGAARWLEISREERPADLAPLMQPFPDGAMESQAVNSWVNTAGHEGPRCLEPPDQEPRQLSLL
jgi:putative SOS response-associated peptidase YedK